MKRCTVALQSQRRSTADEWRICRVCGGAQQQPEQRNCQRPAALFIIWHTSDAAMEAAAFVQIDCVTDSNTVAVLMAANSRRPAFCQTWWLEGFVCALALWAYRQQVMLILQMSNSGGTWRLVCHARGHSAQHQQIKYGHVTSPWQHAHKLAGWNAP